jgi:hypothetical protein
MNTLPLWNVFDDEMTLRGVCAAHDWLHAVRQVAVWHSTGNVGGWSARAAVGGWPEAVPRPVGWGDLMQRPQALGDPF